MLTTQDLITAVLIPLVVAGAIAGLGRWLRWGWLLPLAAGAGFLAAFARLGVPRLPPRDGTDWLFWLTVPLTLLGVLDALIGRWRWGRDWGWVLGISAGLAGWMILHPLENSGAVSGQTLWLTVGALAAAGALLLLGISSAQTRLGSVSLLIGLSVILGAAAVTVLASNLRIVGIYGIAISSAIGASALAWVGTRDNRAARGVAIVAIPLLAGMLVGGRYYPDPGLTLPQFVALMQAPALLLIGALVPLKRIWLRGATATLAAILAVASIAGPAALEAKHAAEKTSDDPYAKMYGAMGK